MVNWQDKVNIYWKKEEQRKKQQELEKELSEKRLYDQQLAQHRAHFRCNVCNKPSSGPFIRQCTDDGGGHLEHFPDWNEPIDLEKCTLCDKWVCSEHIYKSVCKKCAEKL